MTLVAELRRRNVFRVAAAYLVVGWLLTEVLTTILPTLGAPDWAARAVILIFAFGFIPAVVFSWFYELTPEGIKREEEILQDDSIARHTGRKLDYVTVGAVVVLIVFVGLFSAQRTGDESDDVPIVISEASVAVLPFANMSNDKDNEYFSDGLTETLLHMLAQVPDLKVAARTSSFAFKGQNLPVQEIASTLGVAHILEGSVQRSGDNVRITAQLIRASDGFHVWSKTYDRTLDNIFEIQDEIAVTVRGALTESLLGPEDAKLAGVDTTDPDAYELYLQARKARATYSYGGLQAAEDLLKGALLIDPDFLDAKTELASSYIHQMETGLISAEDAVPEILAITEQVLAERPDDPVAQATQIFTTATSAAMNGDYSLMADATSQLEAIVAAYPGELQARVLLVRAYQAQQQDASSVPLLKEALENDPLNPQIHYELGTAYIRLQRWNDARAALERSIEIEPNQPNAYSYLGGTYMLEGDGVGYVKQFLKAVEVDPRDHELPGILAGFLYRLDLVEQGDDLRNHVLALAPTSEVAYQLELLRARAVGDTEAAVASARRAVVDDIEERRGSYFGAVQFLFRHAIDAGQAEEVLAWLEQQAPGMLDVDGDAVPQKHRLIQGLAVEAWYETLPRDEALQRLDRLIDFVTEYGYEPMDDPYTAASVHAMRGEIAAAVDVALERILSRSVAANLGWRDFFSMPHMQAVAGDPRVEVAMQRWEQEEAELRESVRSYLADLQAAT